MKNIYLILIINLIFLSSSSFAQSKKDTLFIAFWNLENLFDTIDETEKCLNEHKGKWSGIKCEDCGSIRTLKINNEGYSFVLGCSNCAVD